MGNVDVQAKGKLYGLLLAIAGCFITIIVIILKGDADAETVAVMAPIGSLLTLLIGYLVGNGAAAAKGIVSVAPFQPSAPTQVAKLREMIAADLDLQVGPDGRVIIPPNAARRSQQEDQ